MLTYVPGKGWVDDTIPAGQPNGPPPIVPPNNDLPPVDPNISPVLDVDPGVILDPSNPGEPI